jgi:hypothetical protein
MSRWNDQFNSHAFRSSWDGIRTALAQSSVDDETVTTSVQELARLRKVVAYIDGILDGLDPELVPLTTWDNFHGQASPCLAQINNYNSNRNIAHINKANEHADNLLTYIRPYMISDGSIGRVMHGAIEEYANTVNEYAGSFKSKASNLLNEIDSIRGKGSELLTSIESQKNLVDQLEIELFGNEDVSGVQDKIRDLLAQSDKIYSEINEFHNEILVGEEPESSTKKLVIDARDHVLECQREIEESLESVSTEVDELKKFHIKVFGKLGEDEKRIGGLSREFDKLIDAVTTFEQVQKEKYSALLEEIEQLLPGATSAGLAAAYRALRKSFSKPIRIYSNLFYLFVVILFAISAVFVVDDVGFWHITFIKTTEPAELLHNFLFKIPFLLPILWLAIFASKRRSEAQRLQQEYAHKEALAKSYQSFKKQIDALGEKAGQVDLMKQLLESAIGAVSYNASVTLDGKHGDKIPTQSFLEKVVDTVVRRKSG